MNYSNGPFMVWGFCRAVKLCFLGRMKMFYSLLACLGVLSIVCVIFRHQGNHAGEADHFHSRSVETMRQRYRELYANKCSSEIPYDQEYVRPAMENDFQVS